MWIKREISRLIRQNHDPIQILRGPRQCGKTSLVLRLDASFQEFSLDDPALRELAQRDPELFLKQAPGKIFIDEAQYAPELFPSLKRRADLYKRSRSVLQTIIRLTGSNQILMDRFVKESLAGRASFFDLGTLSVSEILAAMDIPVQEILFRGGWPELHAHRDKQPTKYLDDFIGSYIEKDIVLAAGIQKSKEFLRFLRLLAGRVGSLLDYASLGRDSGVEANTIKSWVSVLETMQVIYLVEPYNSSLTKRLVKAPKFFFLDTGLACRLQGWKEAAPILTSPQQGRLFENLVLCEIHKASRNYGLGIEIFHWRSRDGEEIDFLLKLANQQLLFVEAKVSARNIAKYPSLPEIKKVFGKDCPHIICCHQEGERIINNQVPIKFLKDYLVSL